MNDIHALNLQEFNYSIERGRKSNAVKTKISKKTSEPAGERKEYLEKSDIKAKIDVEKIVKELKKYNNQLQYFDKEVKLSINEEIDRVVVTVINKNTNKVIYQYPYEELQRLAAHLKNMRGLELDAEV